MKNILGPMHCFVCVASTHLCYCGTKAGNDYLSANGHGCVPIKLDSQTRYGLFLDQRLDFDNSVFRACKVAEVIEENNFLVSPHLVCIILCISDVFPRVEISEFLLSL